MSRTLPRIAAVGGCLLASWLIPLGLYAANAAWLLPILIVAAVASLLRSGSTILDRVVVATGLLFGATCAAGLIMSIWPWRLHPVPVTGFALSALVGLAVLLRRRPALPRRPWTLADSMIVVGTAVVAALVIKPFVGKGFAGRLALLTVGDDYARHFMIFDTIRIVKGYLFQHWAEAAPYTAHFSLTAQVEREFQSYPQGIHFIFALLANHVQGTTAPGDAIAAFDLMTWLYIGSFSWFALIMLWGVRRVAGPAVTRWLAVPALGVATGYLFFGDPIGVFMRGFPSEVAGLALLGLLIALVLRPLHRPREQIVALGALLVGLGFTYYLFLPFAGLAVLAWLWVRRASVPRGFTVVAAVTAVALAAVTPIVNFHGNVGERLLLPGWVVHVNRAAVTGLTALVVAGLLIRAVRRGITWRLALFGILTSGLMAVGLYAYQRATIGYSVYYFEKLLHQMIVVVLLSLGALTIWLTSGVRAGGVPTRKWTLAGGALAVVFTAWAAFGALGARTGLLETNPGRRHLASMDAHPFVGRTVESVVREFPTGDNGTQTMVWMGKDSDPMYNTVYTAVLQRNYPGGVEGYVWLAPWKKDKQTMANLLIFLDQLKRPVRILVDDPARLAELRGIRHPNLTVIDRT